VGGRIHKVGKASQLGCQSAPPDNPAAAAHLERKHHCIKRLIEYLQGGIK